MTTLEDLLIVACQTVFILWIAAICLMCFAAPFGLLAVIYLKVFGG